MNKHLQRDFWDINNYDDYDEPLNINGFRLIHYSCAHGNVKLTQKLAEKNANVNVGDNVFIFFYIKKN